jgi:hypothetical protein
MSTLDFLFSPEVVYFLEQAGALKCGQLPELRNQAEQGKVDAFRW